MSNIRRREFITLLGGAAAAWPLAARSQQPMAKLPTIGFLGSATLLVESQRVAAFVQRLHQLGWIENRNVAIEYRWAEGRTERFTELAAEFARVCTENLIRFDLMTESLSVGRDDCADYPPLEPGRLALQAQELA